MALRFQKRVKIAPGLRLNLSKSGVSTTAGKPGLSITKGHGQTHLNAGIPGTGLSTRTRLDAGPEPRDPTLQGQPDQPGTPGATIATILAACLTIAMVGCLIALIF